MADFRGRCVRTLDIRLVSVGGVNTPVRADLQGRVRLQLSCDALDTASKLMTDQGWSAVTMTAIATAVRVSRQTLYRESPSKATADALVRLTVSHLLQPLDDTDTTVTRLTRLATRCLGLPDPRDRTDQGSPAR